MSRCVFGVCFPLYVSLLAFLSYQDAVVLRYPVLVALVAFIPVTILFLWCPNRRKTIMMVFSIAYGLYAAAFWAESVSTVSLGLPWEEVAELTGVLDDDSILTDNGERLLRLRLSGCGDRTTYSASAKGLSTVLVHAEEPLLQGSVVTVTGRFGEEGFFLGERLQVEVLPSLAEGRGRLLRLLNHLLTERIGDPSSRALARMLILGQSGSDAFVLKDLALKSGCSHILALSGMHLGFVASTVKTLTGLLLGPVIGSLCGFSFALGFVLLVGPKPSLVRALFLYAFLLLLGRRSFARPYGHMLAFLGQTLLFPYSCRTLGFLLSYQAYGALVVASTCSVLLHPACAGFIEGAIVVASTSPVTLTLLGEANLLAVILSAPASLLVKITLYLSFLSLLPLSCFPYLLAKTERALEWLLSTPPRFCPLQVDWTGYWWYLSLLLTTFALLSYAERSHHASRRQAYGLELRLRFPCGDKNAFASAGYGDVQEVRSEFSDLRSHQDENR